MRLRSFALTALFSVFFAPAAAHAMDKQGSAHGGSVAGDSSGFGISGGAMVGASLYNPSYAARPDNTGLALFRYALHFDTDLIGRTLSIPLDLNVLTDRERSGVAKLAPSEFDVITGLTSTMGIAPWSAFELGVRVEHDRPVDGGNFTQTYVDARGRFLYSLGTAFPSLRDALAGGDIGGYLTYGWFIYNPTYAARPDNTGLALFRYGNHTEVSLFDGHVAAGADTTFFTDRTGDAPLAPTELDVTAELIGRKDPVDVHLAYERDMPVDHGGLVQQLVYVLVGYGFELTGKSEEPPKHAPTPPETPSSGSSSRRSGDEA